MKYRIRILLASFLSLILLGMGFHHLNYQLAAPVPEPSHTGGYYEAPFVLELSAPDNGTVYYTTDGSMPTTGSARYIDGIFLENRSDQPNKYASITNVVSDWKDYTPDAAPVPKGTVVRALFVNNLGIESEILTQTYFVGMENPKNGYTLSLVFEDDLFFGEDGIHVTGREYDAWYTSDDPAQPAPTPNFLQKLEVPVLAELIDSQGNNSTQQVQFRLQGASSRGWDKKRFILEADAALNGSNLFSTEFFPSTATHSVMTKNSVPDVIVHDLVSDRAVATQKSVPVDVYFNGEFWYSWYFLERYDNQYFRQYYDVDDVILVKHSVIDPADRERTNYGDMMDWVKHTEFSQEENWTQLNKEVDLQSYIDFISINYYLCNWDYSDDKNCLLWCSAVSEKSPYADRRWRWCIYDVDAITSTHNKFDVGNPAEINIFSCDLPYSETRVNETVFFKALKDVPEFRRQFVLSFMDIVNNNFSVSRVSSVLAKHGRSTDWQDGYFLKRPAYAAAHLAEEFALTGTLETVAVSTADPSMGSVVLNTSRIDLSSGTWSGSYFTDYPVTLTASAEDGYRFVGWKGDANTDSPVLTLPVDGGVSVEAVFEAIQ